jgi:Kae1-associated kinase Bud32
MKEKIIGRGAEALLVHKDNKLVKKRIKKGYRHEKLDLMLRVNRTRREAKLLEKASCVINVPKVKAIDGMRKKAFEPETEIEMEFIDGKLLSQHLDKFPLAKSLKICEKIGESAAKLHDQDIVHGDLTTSNMIFKQDRVYFIDFGLGFYSARAEDKAVDMHLLKEALEAKHFKHWHEYFKSVVEGYKISKNYAAVLERLKKVESRGRYKGKVKG